MSPNQAGWGRVASKEPEPLGQDAWMSCRGGTTSGSGRDAGAPGAGRILALDVARGLTVSLVVFGHTPLPAALIEPLSAVRLPLLFMISGCLVRGAHEATDLRRWVLRRAWRLLVPYATAGLVTYLFWLFNHLFRLPVGRPLELSALEIPWYRPLLGLIYGSTSADWLTFNLPLWFLPTSFCAQMIFGLSLRLTATRSVPTQLMAALAIGALGASVGRRVALPWGLDIAMVVQPFLWMGYRLRQSRLLEGARNLPAAVWLPGAALYVLALWQNEPVFLNARAYGHLAWLYAGGIGGGLVLLRLAQLVSSCPWLRRALAYLGRHSIVILNYHVGLAFPILSKLCYALLGDPLLTAWGLYGIWGILFSAALAWVIQRNDFLQTWLAGQPAVAGAPPGHHLAHGSRRGTGRSQGSPGGLGGPVAVRRGPSGG